MSQNPNACFGTLNVAIVITICPKCALTLSVNAADLRVAQGQVRCGRCLAVFNALLALYDELPGRKASARAAKPDADENATPLPAPATLDDAATASMHQTSPRPMGDVSDSPRLDSRLDDTGVNPALDSDSAPHEIEPDPTATDVNIDVSAEPMLAESLSATQSTIVVTQELLPAETEPVPEHAPEHVTEPAPESIMQQALPDAEPGTAAAQELAAPQIDETLEAANDEWVEELPAANDPYIAEPAAADDLSIEVPGIDLADESTRPVVTRLDFELPEPLEQPEPPDVEPLLKHSAGASTGDPPPVELEVISEIDDMDTEAAAESVATRGLRRTNRLWAVASLLSVLLLAAQLLHANRDAWASSLTFGPALSAVYARLGLPLTPDWDLGAYDVRQQGAVAAEVAGPLTVRASIVNRAPRSQPLPLLRVVLADRFGNKVALRDLQPKEYLPGGKAAAQLAPGQRVDAEVVLADPGGKAVGFEIDACLQVQPGRYRCANDHTDHIAGVR